VTGTKAIVDDASEHSVRRPMQHELARELFQQVGGWIDVPSTPGLGLEVDEAVVRKYAFS
jgi:L-alanine-DL-glutamate epimerase-like enolase superfamily enzyme